MSLIRKSQCLFDAAAPSGLRSERRSDFPREPCPSTTVFGLGPPLCSPHTTTRV